jgi:hypothetical protein
MLDAVQELISLYIEKDPTKFCTYVDSEFGISVLKELCLLRTESINGQLASSIVATSYGQEQNGNVLVDVSVLNISDMSSMNNDIGGEVGFPAGMEPFDRN